MAKTITLYDKNFIDTALNEKADNSEVDGIIDDPTTAVIDDFVLDNGEYKATMNFPLSKVPDTAVLYALCGGKGGQFALKYNGTTLGQPFRLAYVECSDPAVANFTKDGVNYLTNYVEFRLDGRVKAFRDIVIDAPVGGIGAYWWENVTENGVKYWRTKNGGHSFVEGTIPRIYGGGDIPMTDVVVGRPQENHTVGIVKLDNVDTNPYSFYVRLDEYDENTQPEIIDEILSHSTLIYPPNWGSSGLDLVINFTFLDGEQTLSLVPQNGEELDYARLTTESMSVAERINKNKIDITATQTEITTKINAHNNAQGSVHASARNLIKTPANTERDSGYGVAMLKYDNGVAMSWGWQGGFFGVMAATLAVYDEANYNYYYLKGAHGGAGGLSDQPLELKGLFIVRGTVSAHPQDKSKFISGGELNLVNADGTPNDAEINPTADCMTIILVDHNKVEARILFKFGYPSA